MRSRCSWRHSRHRRSADCDRSSRNCRWCPIGRQWSSSVAACSRVIGSAVAALSLISSRRWARTRRAPTSTSTSCTWTRRFWMVSRRRRARRHTRSSVTSPCCDRASSSLPVSPAVNSSAPRPAWATTPSRASCARRRVITCLRWNPRPACATAGRTGSPSASRASTCSSGRGRGWPSPR